METENTNLAERAEVLSCEGLCAVFKDSYRMGLDFRMHPEVRVEVERPDGDGIFQLAEETASRLNRGIDGTYTTYSAGETVRIKSVSFGYGGREESLEWDDYVAAGRPTQITKKTILSVCPSVETRGGNGNYKDKREGNK